MPKLSRPLPPGPYDIIYADPPWEVKRGPDWNSNGPSKPLPYATMTVQDIQALPVPSITARNGWLFLWVINKYIEAGYGVARAWGFKPSVLLTWTKPRHGLGIGGTFVQTTEHLLFARKGKFSACHRIDTTWFAYPRRNNSEKPHEIRALIDSIAPL